MTPVRGVTVWLTGRPASGKTTTALALAVALRRLGYHPCLIDGDHLRAAHGCDLGFSRQDRAENARRAAELAIAAAGRGEVAVVSLVSPYIADRQRVRERHTEADVAFAEIYVDCPPALCEARDPKGLYRRARAGGLTGLTGVDDPYEPPVVPDLVLDTSRLTVAEQRRRLLLYLAPSLGFRKVRPGLQETEPGSRSGEVS